MVYQIHADGIARGRSHGRKQRPAQLRRCAVWATASTPPKPSPGVSSSTSPAGRSPSLATQLRFAMPSKGEEAGPSSVQQMATGFRPLSRVAYQGAPGAYSEMAALKALPNWEPMPCEQFEVAFQALSQVRAASPLGWKEMLGREYVQRGGTEHPHRLFEKDA